MRVSLVIPAFNRERTVAESIESVLRQGVDDIEVIVVDDGSTDGTKDVVQKIALSDKRVLYIRQENGGVSAARNKGLDVASGEAVMFLDSDDVLPLGSLKVLIGVQRQTQCTMAAGSFLYSRSASTKKAGGSRVYGVLQGSAAQVRIKGASDLEKHFAHYMDDKTFLSVCGKLYSACVIKKAGLRFEKGVNVGEDLLFNLAFFTQTLDICIVDTPCYIYRVDSSNSSLSTRVDFTRIEGAKMLYEKSKQFAQTMGMAASAQKTLLKHYWRTLFVLFEKIPSLNDPRVKAVFHKEDPLVMATLKTNARGDKEFLLYKISCALSGGGVIMPRLTVALRHLYRKVARRT